jgi:hypothetical protein
MKPTTPRHDDRAGPIVFSTVPPKADEKNQMAHRVLLTIWTVSKELGLPPPAPSKLIA